MNTLELIVTDQSPFGYGQCVVVMIDGKPLAEEWGLSYQKYLSLDKFLYYFTEPSSDIFDHNIRLPVMTCRCGKDFCPGGLGFRVIETDNAIGWDDPHRPGTEIARFNRDYKPPGEMRCNYNFSKLNYQHELSRLIRQIEVQQYNKILLCRKNRIEIDSIKKQCLIHIENEQDLYSIIFADDVIKIVTRISRSTLFLHFYQMHNREVNEDILNKLTDCGALNRMMLNKEAMADLFDIFSYVDYFEEEVGGFYTKAEMDIIRGLSGIIFYSHIK